MSEEMEKTKEGGGGQVGGGEREGGDNLQSCILSERTQRSEWRVYVCLLYGSV